MSFLIDKLAWIKFNIHIFQSIEYIDLNLDPVE